MNFRYRAQLRQPVLTVSIQEIGININISACQTLQVLKKLRWKLDSAPEASEKPGKAEKSG